MSGTFSIVVELIAFVAHIVGLIMHGIEFGKGHHPERPIHNKVAYRIQLGVDVGTELSRDMGGAAPKIRVWDEAGEFLGVNHTPESQTDGHNKAPSWILDGDFGDVTVDLSFPHQPTYTLFSTNDDSLCIAYITTTWADANKFTWMGTWGRGCGYLWYYSNIYLGDRTNLTCTWIGPPEDNKTQTTGLSLHFPEFDAKKGDNYTGVDVEGKFCAQTPTQKFYKDVRPTTMDVWTPRGHASRPSEEVPAVMAGDKPSSRRRRRHLLVENSTSMLSNWQEEADAPVFWEEGGDVTSLAVPDADDAAERSQRSLDLGHAGLSVSDVRKDAFTQLVLSPAEGHSARALCADPTAAGPNFVSLAEGLFCNLHTREVLPLCRDGAAVDCFDHHPARAVVRRGLATRDAAHPSDSMAYSRVITFFDGHDWEATPGLASTGFARRDLFEPRVVAIAPRAASPVVVAPFLPGMTNETSAAVVFNGTHVGSGTSVVMNGTVVALNGTTVVNGTFFFPVVSNYTFAMRGVGPRH